MFHLSKYTELSHSEKNSFGHPYAVKKKTGFEKKISIKTQCMQIKMIRACFALVFCK